MTVKKSPSFSRALVTGASSGIGTAMSRLLAKKGISLILTGRNQEQLHSLATELSTLVPVEIIVADLTKTGERFVLINTIREQAPDLVINNAGFGLYGKATDTPIEQQLQMIDLNARTAFEITLEAANALKQKQRHGVILNVSSIAGFYTFPYMAAYAASKAFITNVSQALDEEMRESGIRILASCPGMVDTNFAKRAGGKHSTSPSFLVMSPEYAAEEMWKQIIRRKSLHLFSNIYRWLTFGITPLLPKKWVMKILKNNIKSRTTK